MQVNNYPIIYDKPNSKPAFTSNEIFVKEAGKFYQTSTSFFRKDMKWEKLVNRLAEKYHNVKSVNTQCWGCSDGSEPFTLAMMMIEKMGENAKKFFPIKAFDIDGNALKMAKSGEVKLTREDVKRIKATLGENYKKYIEFDLPVTKKHIKIT